MINPGSSISCLSTSCESGGSWNFSISTRPPANVSVLMADGVRSVRAISAAQFSSGLTDRLRPRSSEMRFSSSSYSGLRTRAIVCRAPSFFATRQQSRFSSSDAVTAISRSALSTPASSCVADIAPLPSTQRMSRSSTVCCSGTAFWSMMVTSWPSRLSCSASVEPIFPSPTMTIFILSPPCSSVLIPFILSCSHRKSNLQKLFSFPLFSFPLFSFPAAPLRRKRPPPSGGGLETVKKL